MTGAKLASTNPAIESQDLRYAYDAAGNRVSETVNGVTRLYATNALNQYTQVGGTRYTYDADGNMASKTDAGGTTTFSCLSRYLPTHRRTPRDHAPINAVRITTAEYQG